MSGWDIARGVLGKVAPLAAAALGGPFAPVISAGLSAILGTSDDPDAIQQAMTKGHLTGDQIIAMQRLEDDLKVQLAQLQIKSVEDLQKFNLEMEKVQAADRDSARDREIHTGDVWTPRILAGIIVLGFLWALWYVLSGRVQGLKDPTVMGLVGTLIGYVSAKADAIVNYYFGSSSGSERKTELLYRSAPGGGIPK